MLQETFILLLTKYSNNHELINELWLEIEKHYSSKKRYYHTLQHLDNLLIQLNKVKKNIQDWDTVLFSLYYHDIIYNALKSDNEEKSAELAANSMQQLAIPAQMIDACKQQILATKSHLVNQQPDTNYFTDADLSVLGQDWEIYFEYCQNVRKEYSYYPNLIYNAGRKKVLKHFLAMESIYKTDYFFNEFEKQAKLNLTNELELL
ncbi:MULTISPECIES: hypothetical protein [unclassified Arcicella]|uniref:HD domain-containing protein n=1 Tax=unclassified Arcicella TaxID=2644986 RepID=UPI002857C7E8|nr:MULTISPECIES: hypothetical protein [unclassified Arcicella]MDR6564698.1 putative metal-dependent HD superfamily phosphohydrolase [Arcicella sp. BE51]MDR6814494.1 putative metal-dependent HD superfamily phosphohydrolase [Arcicella sp. BE140]MDR6825919.1 putative metal-dependent HD superfamily phosphohydrolase [Arcicella sp. BE139]